MIEVPLDDIQVGERHRQDLGDLSDLQASIADKGLLHPIVVTPEYNLIAGERRIEAVRQLGWDSVSVTVIRDLSEIQILEAERDENVCRRDMTPEEKVLVGRKIEALEKPKARERQAHGQTAPGKNASENFTEASGYHTQTRDVVGGAVDMSGPTYQRAKAVVEAAEDDPETYGDLLDKMNEKGKVAGAHDELQARRRARDPLPKSRSGENGRERVGSRTVKQAVSSLQQAALNVDSAAAGFDMESFGDLSLIAPHPEAQQWIEMLADATRRLSAHVRTVRRYQKEAQ